MFIPANAKKFTFPFGYPQETVYLVASKSSSTKKCLTGINHQTIRIGRLGMLFLMAHEYLRLIWLGYFIGVYE